ncbi:MAG: hypothetical protein AAF829_10050 [Pseudomonadota bacterium]
MKRAHKRMHLVMWAVLGPALFVVLALAILHRPGEPVNEALPDVLTVEAE